MSNRLQMCPQCNALPGEAHGNGCPRRIHGEDIFGGDLYTTAEATRLGEIVRKDDAGKLRYDLLPADALELVIKLYGDGAKKYGERNWEKGLGYGQVFAAMMRHAWAWFRGQDYDSDPVGSSQHHMASVAWCALTLLAYHLRKTGTDDRPRV